MSGYKAGIVTEYYENLGVAIVDLTQNLHVGDLIRVSGSVEFGQVIQVMQMEHEKVQLAKAGETVGLTLSKPVAPGDEIIKTEL